MVLGKTTLYMKRTKDNQTREFHTVMEISRSRRKTFYRPIEETKKDQWEKVGMIGREILAKLFVIDGITKVVIEPYKFTATIAELYSWADLSEVVEREIREFFLRIEEEKQRKKEIIREIIS